MAFSLYDATVPPYLQMLGALEHMLEKAEKWCAEEGVGEEALLQSRLASDMLPFAYQVKVAAHHSAGALHGVRKGSFSPQRIATRDTLDVLRARIRWALDECGAITRKEVNSWVGRPMRFVVRGHAKPYVAERFLMSFSQPNFYFHVTTAYALMRVAGMDIGKSDYLGVLQTQDNQCNEPRAHTLVRN